ncbi:MAG: FHA domain-containing protein [Clostridia bacterium]|nr:FHA domain-containing protein [Clostridia bacterium]
MNQVRCANHHFYDADQFSQCPHCGDITQIPDKTVSLGTGYNGSTTVPIMSGTVTMPQEGVTEAVYPSFGGADGPVVGWLVCTKGAHEGEAFVLRREKNSVGRQSASGSGSSELRVNLNRENTVSRGKQADVIYDPRQNIFIAQSGDSRQLLYVNGVLALEPVPLAKNDRLLLGEAELMLIPCCDAAFTWPCFAK